MKTEKFIQAEIDGELLPDRFDTVEQAMDAVRAVFAQDRAKKEAWIGMVNHMVLLGMKNKKRQV